MSISVKCPGCGSAYEMDDNTSGKKVRCKKCSETFLVKATTSLKQKGEEEESRDLRPRRPAARRDDDDDDDRPRKRRRHENDDDDGDDGSPRPRRKQKVSGVPVQLIVGGVLLGVFLLFGIAVGAWFLFSKKPEQVQAATPSSNSGSGAVSNTNPNTAGSPQIPGRSTEVSVVLSNPRAEPGLAGRKIFSVDYRFERGRPMLGKHYFLIIKSRQNIGERYIAAIELQTQGNLTAEPPRGTAAVRDSGPYEFFMEISNNPATGRGGPERERISDSITLK